MKNIKTFVVCHSQDIILDFIKCKKFDKFNNYSFIFVGNKDFNKIKNIPNVIIARNFTDNIEHYPKFTAYTAWYILNKNKDLIDSNYINLFEYDVNIASNFYDKNIETINREDSPDYIGYFPLSINHPFFINYTDFADTLIESLYRRYDINVHSLIKELNIKYNNKMLWSGSNNCTWKKETFFNFMEWFEPLIPDLKDNKFCGHMQERAVSIFFLYKKLNALLMPNYIEHFHLNTHDTSLRPQAESAHMYEYLLTS
jgi:hypothetical protein